MYGKIVMKWLVSDIDLQIVPQIQLFSEVEFKF